MIPTENIQQELKRQRAQKAMSMAMNPNMDMPVIKTPNITNQSDIANPIVVPEQLTTPEPRPQEARNLSKFSNPKQDINQEGGFDISALLSGLGKGAMDVGGAVGGALLDPKNQPALARIAAGLATQKGNVGVGMGYLDTAENLDKQALEQQKLAAANTKLTTDTNQDIIKNKLEQDKLNAALDKENRDRERQLIEENKKNQKAIIMERLSKGMLQPEDAQRAMEAIDSGSEYTIKGGKAPLNILNTKIGGRKDIVNTPNQTTENPLIAQLRSKGASEAEINQVKKEKGW